MKSHPKPLSPHLQVYKPQITSALSILHRITGVGLLLGFLVLLYWFGSAAAGPAAYKVSQEWLGSFLMYILFFGFTWALYYHLCSGIRHLIWDAGKGFDLPFVYKSGKAVLVISALLTIVSYIVGLSV
jgi:succinate dehydrogenase / fumarate reductase cytochrome b subunit